MGGTNSKKSVKAKQLKNYMGDEEIKAKAIEQGVDPTLLAYAHQKNDIHQVKQEQLSQRGKQNEALKVQEAALQNRIDQVEQDRIKASQMRLNIDKMDSKQNAGEKITRNNAASMANSTQVTRSAIAIVDPSAQGASTPREQRHVHFQQPQQTTKVVASQQLANSTAGQQDQSQIKINQRIQGQQQAPAPQQAQTSPIIPPARSVFGADSRRIEKEAAEERKIAELRRIQKEAKASKQFQQQQQQQLVSAQSSPDKVMKGKSPVRTHYLEQDSEEEDDVDHRFNLQRQVSGVANANQTAQIQVTTVDYSNQLNNKRNILDPSLMSAAMRTNPHQNLILLGVQETESAEDMEAQRNRNINLQELQSLFV